MVGLIRRLRKAPDMDVLQVGEGCDHWAFDVDGAFIVRARKETDEHTAAAVERETALLEIVSRVSPVPVPQVVAAEPEAGLIVFRRLAGTSLLDRPPADPPAFAESLAEFVASIHAVPRSVVECLVGPDEYPLEAYQSEAFDWMNDVAAYLTEAQRHSVELFLASPAPPESRRRTFCHNDLGAEHVLAAEDRSALTGIIDWSDAAIADPARDVGRLLRDFGLGLAEAVLRRTGCGDDVLTRATFYARVALLEDLAYGIQTSRSEHVAHALGRFAETFA